MSRRATGSMELKSWDEHPYSEIDGGPNLTRASVNNSLHGDIEGEGTLQYLMIYHDDGSCSFMGLERVVGHIGDRSGSLVLQHSGTFEGNSVTCTLSVVPGSGTGDLRGLRGEGGFVARLGQQATPFTLHYAVE